MVDYSIFRDTCIFHNLFLTFSFFSYHFVTISLYNHSQIEYRKRDYHESKKNYSHWRLCQSLVLKPCNRMVLANEAPTNPTSTTQVNSSAFKQAVRNSLYDAVNKEYLDPLTIPDDQFMAGVSTDIAEQNKKILHQDLAKLGDGDIQTETPEEATMAAYYNQARDFQRRNQEGSAPAKPYLEQIESLTSFDDFKEHLEGWINSGIDLPFMLTAGANLEQPETNQLRLIAPSPILPGTNLYQEEPLRGT